VAMEVRRMCMGRVWLVWVSKLSAARQAGECTLWCALPAQLQ